jgi:hypothetical protein
MGEELAQDAVWADVEKHLLGNVSLNAVAA